MSIFWISAIAVYVLLFLVGFISNKREYEGWGFYIDINLFNSPFYHLGITNQHIPHEDNEPCATELKIGFVLFTVGFIFFDLIEEDES